MKDVREVDALIVGAGMGGVLSLHKLTNELGLNAIAIDKAPGIGGTWYWNRYPGALSDTQAHMYQFPFEEELYQRTEWTTRYVTSAEIRQYLEDAVDLWGIRSRIELDTELRIASFEEDSGTWLAETSTGTIRARFLITALGLLSQKNIPDIPGIKEFAGTVVHTTEWPDDLDLRGKRVGVIGNGSTGVQLMTELAKVVGHLTSFQRTAQYSVPAGNRPYTPEELAGFKADPTKLWDGLATSQIGFGLAEATRKAFDVSAEEREAIFEEAWQRGGNFTFTHETFADVMSDRAANDEAAAFIKRKIASIVKDPETARKLMPTEIFARRPICDSGYFEIFNQPNVTLVSTRETPIEKFLPQGVVTEDGELHELDVLILATGFDAIEGSYRNLDIRGRGGERLAEHWSEGAKSHLGVTVSGFPNMFMVLGPLGPFVNLAPAIGIEVRWLTEAIRGVAQTPGATIELTPEAEEAWLEHCLELLEGSLFMETKSWIFGANIPGKKTARSASYYTGGLSNYVAIITDEAERGYPSYSVKVPSSV